MGLFDILSGFISNQSQHAALVEEVGSLVNQEGGVSGLAQKFQQNGLGGMMSSWISNGPNPPISGEQVIQVLGRDRVMAIAAKAGFTEDQVAQGISHILPVLIDHLTPNGTAQGHSPAEVDNAVGALKSKL